MGHDQGCAVEIEQHLFEGAERCDVQVVRRLVEQHQVRRRAQHLGQRDPRALPAGKRAHRLSLFVPVEQKSLQVASGVEDLARDLEAALIADVVEDALVQIEARALLVEVGDLGVLPDRQPTTGGRELTGDGAEQGGLAGSVGADDAHSLTLRQVKREVLHQRAPAEVEAEVFELEHGLARASLLQRQRHALLGHRSLGRLGGFSAVDSGLLLGAARLGLACQPLELAAQEVLAVRFGAIFVGGSRRLGFEVGLVAAVVAGENAAFELERARAHAVEQVAIVSHQEQGARMFFEQIALEPVDGARRPSGSWVRPRWPARAGRSGSELAPPGAFPRRSCCPRPDRVAEKYLRGPTWNRPRGRVANLRGVRSREPARRALRAAPVSDRGSAARPARRSAPWRAPSSRAPRSRARGVCT